MTHTSGSYPPHEDANGANSTHSTPQIYSAVYSAVDVYEMEVNGIAVMRRRKDSWLNATQILKVAGIEKGKRTKVLEKEILIGEHEKVQGGYGKYQGTWIKFERGVEFCRQYGVEELLRPLLTYDMGQDGGIAGGGIIDTPTKEQAMAAQRKRLYNSSSESKSSAPSGTFFKNISSTASHAVAAINKARHDSPAPRSRRSVNISSNPRAYSRQLSQQHLDSQDTVFTGGSEQTTQNFMSADGYNSGQSNPAYPVACAPMINTEMNNKFDELPSKRIKPSPSMDAPQQSIHDIVPCVPSQEISPMESDGSLIRHSQNIQQVNSVGLPLPPIQAPINTYTNAKKELLMSLFSNSTSIDFTSHKVFQTFSPEDLDLPIDGSNNTALIWAATLARVELLKTLIAHGASTFRVNSIGETALMRSCLVTNNLEMGTFPEILELLGPTIEFRDSKGRTVLHHITIASAVKGRSQASKYYLESLLEFIVRSNNGNDIQPSTDGQQFPKPMSIGRFMSEIVNIQDRNGDTALMTAARIGNRSIISQLIEVGADTSIPNRSQLTPGDFGVSNGTENPNQELPSGIIPRLEPKEKSKDIISSITSILSESEKEFFAEMNKKQVTIDELHTKLRVESEVLGQRRRFYETFQAQQQEIDSRSLKVENLAKSCDEEQTRLAQIKQIHNYTSTEDMTELGDADKPYRTPENILDAFHEVDLNQHQTLKIDQAEIKKSTSTLPSIHTLQTRINAYKTINEGLESSIQELKGKDSEITSKYRKIISLCTGVDEHRVEENIASLVRSLESEHDDVELGRVREFLSKVEEV
ncbi:Transcription factor [Podosphaera aphanis]|nr:Transcription factor [Podosphaera aphanis]